MFRRPHYIALGLMVVLTLMVLNLPSKTTTRIKLSIGSLFVPLFGLANSSQRVVDQATDSLLPRSELLKQLEALKGENQQLRLQAMQDERTTQENQRLRQLLNWQPQKRWKVRLATVVLREPANWWRTVQIDLGSRDGIKTNMPVLTADGLVGRVGEVGLIRSQVVLVGDPNCKVAARVDNANRDTGVVGPAGPLERELAEMGYLSRNAELKPGQEVITSGLGGLFPPNIPIGKIVDAHPVEHGLYTVARVRLGAKLSALEEVWVMSQP